MIGLCEQVSRWLLQRRRRRSLRIADIVLAIMGVSLGWVVGAQPEQASRRLLRHPLPQFFDLPGSSRPDGDVVMRPFVGQVEGVGGLHPPNGEPPDCCCLAMFDSTWLPALNGARI